MGTLEASQGDRRAEWCIVILQAKISAETQYPHGTEGAFLNLVISRAHHENS